MKVYIRNKQRTVKVNQQKTVKLLRKAFHLLGLQRAELSILFVNDRTIKLLNCTFRGVDKTTDVLSFPQSLPPFNSPLGKGGYRGVIKSALRTPHFVLGDIVINLQRAKRQAIEQGITLNEELKRLTIHGLLHLLGYDHEKSRYQKDKMESKERKLLQDL
jgi:probable rRNA maturation factor